MIKTKTWIWIFSLLLVVSLGSWLFLQHSKTERPVARVTHKGVCIRTIDLTKEGNFSFRVEGETLYNIVQVENGRIRVLEANCPDQICVKRGWTESGAEPVVCLPNGLVIEIVSDETEIDGVAG